MIGPSIAEGGGSKGIVIDSQPKPSWETLLAIACMKEGCEETLRAVPGINDKEKHSARYPDGDRELTHDAKKPPM